MQRKFQPWNELPDPEHYDVNREQLQMTAEEGTMKQQQNMVHTEQVEDEGWLKFTLYQEEERYTADEKLANDETHDENHQQ